MLIICKGIGFGLLFIHWTETGEATGFLPIMAIGIMTMLRFRMPRLWSSIIIDGILLLFLGRYLALSVFVISELFYGAWESEHKRGLKLRDTEASKYYELEQLQGDLLAASAQIERMTAVSERARIAAEIHDNAGHEIIGAYMSLQTARELLSDSNTEALDLYDMALGRLDSGVNKIREAVHNLSPVTALGVEALRETCGRFPVCGVQFNTYGNLSAVPIYCWNLLDACLNESFTNIVRHADAKQVKVDLDATPNIIRLCIENDGAKSKIKGAGIGLRNLRHRTAAVGGNLSVDAGEVFKVICVIPIGGP
jgi:signal transduction histidine kinase